MRNHTISSSPSTRYHVAGPRPPIAGAEDRRRHAGAQHWRHPQRRTGHPAESAVVPDAAQAGRQSARLAVRARLDVAVRGHGLRIVSRVAADGRRSGRRRPVSAGRVRADRVRRAAGAEPDVDAAVLRQARPEVGERMGRVDDCCAIPVN